MTSSLLGAEREALVALSAALASRDGEALKAAMGACLAAAPPEKVEEVLLQSYLFLGYPVALNAFGLWRELSGREAGPGVADDWEVWWGRGESVCRIVYGGQYEDLRRNVRALHPDMERWMVVEGYGKVLGREELELATRELCIGALLAVLGAPRQLYSHLRGALNAGALPGEVKEALGVACRHMDGEGCRVAEEVWERIRLRSDGAGDAAPPQA